MIAVHPISRPRWPARRGDQGIEFVLVHHEIDAFFARKFQVLCQRIFVRLLSQRPFRLSFDHDVLSEPGHLSITILLVEVDDLFQGFHRRARAERSQVRIQIGFEFIKQHFKFRIVELALRRNVRGIDDGRAMTLDDIDAVVHQLIDCIVEAERFSMDADARTAETISVEELRIIARGLTCLRLRSAIT